MCDVENQDERPALHSMSLRGSATGRLEGQRLRTRQQAIRHSFTSLPSLSNGCGEEQALHSVSEVEPRYLPTPDMLSKSTIRLHLELRQVLQRIDTFVQAKSLSFRVDVERACIECCTLGCSLKFSVYLWWIKENESRVLIVELQRRDGCSVLLHRIRKALFQYLQTGECPGREACDGCYENMTVSRRIKQMMEEMGGHRRENKPDEVVWRESIECCRHLLNSQRLDMNELGLASLASLIDPDKNTQQVDQVVESILKDEGGLSLHECFFQLLRTSTSRTALQDSLWKEKTFDKDDEQGDRTLVISALTVLAHVLKSNFCHQRPDFGDLFDQNAWRIVVRALRSCLRHPAQRPQEAALAVQCIRLMEEKDPNSSHVFKGEEFIEQLLGARRCGEMRYRRLQQESERLLDHLADGC